MAEDHTPESLAEKYTREELDNLAREEGLDPTEYATKADLAEAIMAPKDDDALEPLDSSGDDLALEPKGDLANTADEDDEPDEDAPPAPITPDPSAAQHRDRIGFENEVNARVDTFLADARVPLTEAYLRGATVELDITEPE